MAALRIDIIGDDANLPALADDWSALLGETPESSGFQSLAWISACRSGLPPDRSLLVLVFRDGRDVVAIMPTEIGPAGDLRLIGHGPLSNYLGPVYRASHAEQVVEALGAFLGHERRVSLVDFRGLREHSPFVAALCRMTVSGWSRPRAEQVLTCPYVDLASGWEAVYARRKGTHRANTARRWKQLERLGHADFVEVVDPAGVEAALPAMFDLFRKRWAGRHDSGGFAGCHRSFHAQAALALAAAGHVRLSLLRLDRQVVAFNYGLRTGGVTAGYVMAHDDALRVYSPGSLLLVRLLEAACRRGDREYDFAGGEEDYKDAWATGTRAVLRVLCWRQGSAAVLRGRLRALGTRAWVGARSIDWLRDLRREGIRRLLPGSPRDVLPDAPGLPAGAGGTWHVQRLVGRTSGAEVTIRSWAYQELAQRLSPRLLELAADRSFRGDTLLPLFRSETLLGVAWRADHKRRSLTTGGVALPDGDTVFYHPVVAPGSTLAEVITALADLAVPQAAVVVGHEQLPGTFAEQLGTFVADHRFRGATPREADAPRSSV